MNPLLKHSPAEQARLIREAVRESRAALAAYKRDGVITAQEHRELVAELKAAAAAGIVEVAEFRVRIG